MDLPEPLTLTHWERLFPALRLVINLRQVGLVVGLVFVCAAIAFKISAVPFHMWTPDVYEGAPTPVTAFFASAPKVAAIALFARLLSDPFGSLVSEWQQIIVFVALASMILGSLAAIKQTNIKTSDGL